MITAFGLLLPQICGTLNKITNFLKVLVPSHSQFLIENFNAENIKVGIEKKQFDLREEQKTFWTALFNCGTITSLFLEKQTFFLGAEEAKQTQNCSEILTSEENPVVLVKTSLVAHLLKL